MGPVQSFEVDGRCITIWRIGEDQHPDDAQGEDRCPGSTQGEGHCPEPSAAGAGAGEVSPGRGAAPLPFVYLHVYDGNGADVAEACESIGCAPCVLVAVKPACWNDDMTPWECPGLFAGDKPFAGRAEQELHLLEREIIPHVEALMRASANAPSPSPGVPADASSPSPDTHADPGAQADSSSPSSGTHDDPGVPAGARPLRIIAGYSLAGLFALWAQARSTTLDRVASASGSLWYPGFARFVQESAMARPPECVFISLGKKETKTPSRLLRNVAHGTDEVVASLRGKGIPTHFVLNPGNHFKEPALRMARGIAWCVSWPNVTREDDVSASSPPTTPESP